MEIRELDKQISTGNIAKLYFFFGPEQFLLEKKITSIKKKIIPTELEEFNYIKFDSKKVSAEDIIHALRSVPVMSEKIMVVVKNSGIFENSKQKDYSRICDELSLLPDYLCVIFAEDEFSKKKEKNLEIFKGNVVKFDFLPQAQFELWLEKMFDEQGKSILMRDIKKISERCGFSMANAYNEYNKIIAYVGERKQITDEDVDRVVTKTIDAKIFDIIDNIALKRTSQTLSEIRALESSGENASMVMTLISTRISELLMVKHLVSERVASSGIAEYFEPRRPPFVIDKLINQSKKFEEEYLRRMTLKGIKYTADVRSGLLDKWVAVEMYVAELINK